jgi:hypothetical protein
MAAQDHVASSVNVTGTDQKIDTPGTQPGSLDVHGWQPIETAPKMKTILLFAVTEIAEDGTVLNWRMESGYWNSGWENDDNRSPWNWGYQLYKSDVQPTQWMPLPAPPVLP